MPSDAPFPTVAQMEARRIAFSQREFIRQNHYLISPWMYPLPVHIQLAQNRIVLGWKECAERMNGGQ